MLSVIVPSYNSAATIRLTLDGLLSQPKGVVDEVIVVDSSDDATTRFYLKEYERKGVRVNRLPHRANPAQARNIGARQAVGEVLAFIDSDAYPAADWAEKIVEVRQSGVRAGGGSVGIPESQRAKPIALAQWFLQFNEYLDAGSAREKTFVPSCNLFCERALFNQTGGFPEIRAAEDVMFGWRLAAAGVKIRFVPEIRVYHVFRERMRAYAKNQAMLGKYTILYRRQQFGSWIYRGIVPILLFPAFLAVKTARIVGRILQTGDRKKMHEFLRSLHLFVIGLICWSAGFLRGCVSRGREVSYA